MVRISVSLFGHLQCQPAWNNFWKTPRLKCYSTTYILRAGKLWPKWMLISLWPFERITLFVTDWLHRLLLFLNKLIAKEDSAIRDRWSSKAPPTFTSRPARISVMSVISLWELLAGAHLDRCCFPRCRSCGSLRRSCSVGPDWPGRSEVCGWRPGHSWRSTRAVLQRGEGHITDQ